MVRHIVMVNYRPGFTDEENRANALETKRLLEGLRESIPGIAEFKVYIDALPSSNKDVVFNTLFESEEALAAYQRHPDHVCVAQFVASVMCDRVCIDYHE